MLSLEYAFMQVQAEGTATPSCTTSWLSRNGGDLDGEENQEMSRVIQFIAGANFLAGYETVGVSLSMSIDHDIDCCPRSIGIVHAIELCTCHGLEP